MNHKNEKKMKSRFLTIMLFVLGTTMLVGCKKEGCIDPNAVNYSYDAKKDDGSCNYEGRVLFHYGESTAINLQDYGSSSLVFYLDDKVVGSTSTDVFWNEIPECGDDGSITVTKDLGISKNKTYYYYVEDDMGDVIWEGFANVEANTCLRISLTL